MKIAPQNIIFLYKLLLSKELDKRLQMFYSDIDTSNSEI
jgi:hypothetical protein